MSFDVVAGHTLTRLLGAATADGFLGGCAGPCLLGLHVRPFAERFDLTNDVSRFGPLRGSVCSPSNLALTR